MEKSEIAVKFFDEGNSCAQSVLASYGDLVGLNEKEAFRIGAALGGGMGRKQFVCGAISAGVVLLGMKYGNSQPNDPENKEKTSIKVKEYIEECESVLGATHCKDLLNIDLNNPDEKAKANANGLFARVCNNAVMQAGIILEKHLER